MSDILVLNSSYLPVAKTNAERSILLILLNKAYSIKDSDIVFRSPTFSINVPEAIVLKEYNLFRREKIIPTKKNVMNLYNHTCQLCGENQRNLLTLEHVIPRSRFRKVARERNLCYDVSDFQNVTVLCRECNVTKSDKLPEEMGWNFKAKEPISALVWDWAALYDLGIKE